MPAAEPPVIDEPTTEESPGLNPELVALLDRVMPKDGGPMEAQPELPVVEEPGGEPEKPKAALKAEPEKVTAPKVEPEKDAIQSRLAPDLSKKEEPKPEAEVEIDMPEEPPASIKTEKGKADYKKWRQEFATLKRENLTLKTQQPAPKTEDPDAQAVIEQQKQQIAQLSEIVQRSELKAHPQFQQRFIIPRTRNMTEVQRIVKEMGGDPDTVEHALSLKGRAKVTALDDIVSGIESPVLRDKIGRLIDGIESIDLEMENVLKDSKGTAEQLRRQDKIAHHEQVMQQEQQLKSLLGAARKDLSDNLGLEVLKKTGKPEYKWWDDQVDEIDATAHSILFEGTPDKMAFAAVLAASAGPLRAAWQAERKARVALEERIAAMEGAEPDLGDKTKVRDTETEVPEDADMATAVIARLRARK